MTFDDFKASLSLRAPPPGVAGPLLALWHDARGNWDTAHEIAQDVATESGAWVHAYLHRKEGDPGNAAYWYRRARRPEARMSLDEEWALIVAALLA
jgi:dienelactone hydrolase